MHSCNAIHLANNLTRFVAAWLSAAIGDLVVTPNSSVIGLNSVAPFSTPATIDTVDTGHSNLVGVAIDSLTSNIVVRISNAFVAIGSKHGVLVGLIVDKMSLSNAVRVVCTTIIVGAGHSNLVGLVVDDLIPSNFVHVFHAIVGIDVEHGDLAKMTVDSLIIGDILACLMPLSPVTVDSNSPKAHIVVDLSTFGSASNRVDLGLAVTAGGGNRMLVDLVVVALVAVGSVAVSLIVIGFMLVGLSFTGGVPVFQCLEYCGACVVAFRLLQLELIFEETQLYS